MKEGIIVARTIQAQMVSLSGTLGSEIMREIRSSAVKPYSALRQKSRIIEAEILRSRANETKITTTYAEERSVL